MVGAELHHEMTNVQVELARVPLVGSGGERVDFWRTVRSHGLVTLPPMQVDDAARTLDLVLSSPGGPRLVHLDEPERGNLRVRVSGPVPGSDGDALIAGVRHVLRFDDDLSEFYERVRDDPQLAWVTAGAGRMVRSPTVFEDLIKTVCTTNCAFSATRRMVGALVAQLGEPVQLAVPGGVDPPDPGGVDPPDPGGVDPPDPGARGVRAFPTPAAMAAADERFYRDIARTGYRGVYLRRIAEQVAGGELDVEAWGRASRDQLSDDELEARLLALPGVGPYAAAHMLMLLGRYSRLILDSWTRPTYVRLIGRRASDATILRRFRRYGHWRGLAFWLVLTRAWVDEQG